MAVKSGNIMFSGLTLLFLLALTSSPALALDTLEPYDPGVSDFQFYTSLLGLGQSERTIRGDVLLGIGLNDWLSGHIYSAGEANQYLDGKGAEFGFGIFSNQVDTDSLDVDIGVNLTTGGEDHEDFVLTPFFEVNLDSDPEMNGYGAWLWMEEALSGTGTTLTPVTSMVFGGYYTFREGHQFLAAFDVAFNHRNGPDEHKVEVGGITLGYNGEITTDIELISEMVFDIPQDDSDNNIDEDFGFGLMLGFIAALP